MPPPKLRSRWFAWWYFTIALGFVLLAINRALVGEKVWLIALRFVIAAGFAALGYVELRSGKRS
ncbi:MAG: hypothetical protein LAP39_21925 [Acidobacteriia bacterium]|nr:hypothetical protein [Terriglobia bacterium]